MSFKRPLTLLLVFIILFLSGCSNTAQTTKSEPEQPKQIQEIAQPVIEQKITPSFPTTTYSSPFLEFVYPADWELYTDSFNIPDIDTVVVYRGYIELPHNDNNMVLIMVGRNNNTTIKTSVEIRDISLNKLINLEKAGKAELKDKGVINDNIATLDAINWDRTPMRMKTYYYINNDGKFYMAYITTYNDNWDKTQTQEIIKVFEQSLKFKK
jgi:hypothetical protein